MPKGAVFSKKSVSRKSINFLLLALAAMLCSSVWPTKIAAQGGTAAINGTISDPSGAVVPGAKVVLRNLATNAERTTVTNEAGFYAFTSINPGNYKLGVSKEGFVTVTQESFTLNVNQTATYDLALSLGATTQEVTVRAAAAAIQSSTAELGTAITTQKVNDLPLNGRNFTQLLTLTPGVSPVSVAQNAGGGGGFAGKALGSFSFPAVHGARNRSNLFYLDGIQDTGSFIDNFNYQPVIDEIQEFKVQGHNDQAEFGQGVGGLVNVATKSGSNEFHGTLWEFLRNDKLDARNFFFKDRTKLKQNQYGGTFGGPISIPHVYNGKNRAFFFLTFEGFRQHRGAEGLFITPTPANLKGDLSDQPGQIFNPFSGRFDPNNPGKFIRDPFMCDSAGNPLQPNSSGVQPAGTPCNKIPQSLINPATQLFGTTVFPGPTNTGVTGFNGVDRTPTVTTQDSANLRLDYQIGTRDSIMGRISEYNQVDSQSNGRPGALQKIFLHGYNYGVRETHTFSPMTVGDFFFGRNWGQDNVVSDLANVPAGFIGQLESAGVASNFVTFQGGGSLIPAFNVTGFLPGAAQRLQDTRISDIWQFGGDISVVHGLHTFKAGAIFQTNNSRSPIFGSSTTYTATPTTNPASPSGTGNSLASFLLGLPSSAEKRDVLEIEHGGWVNGFYFQDQWKTTDKLTINLGLRYDYTLWPIYGDPKAKSGFVGDLDLNNGQYILTRVPPACSATRGEPCIPGGVLPANVAVTPNKNGSIIQNGFTNFQPRFGLAYSLSPKVVIRGSYGRFYDNWNSIIQLAQNYEGTWPRVGQLLAQNLNNTLIDASAGDPFNLGSSGVVIPGPTPFKQVQWFVDPRLGKNMPFSDQWNFGIQYQLGSDTVMSANYVGSHSSRLNLGGFKNTAQFPGPGDKATVASRRPFPFISPTFYDQNIGRSNYNAFEFSLDRRAGKGLSYLVSYTYSKSIDIACSGNFGAEGCELQNAFNINADRSVSGFDLTHIFSGSWVWQLPFGSGQRYSSGNKILNNLIANWTINGILTMSSGAPYDVLVSGDIANTGNVTERANLIGSRANTVPPGGAKPTQWLNKAAFAVPPNFTFGTLGRNTLRANWRRNLDLSVFRDIPITERTNLQFRAEGFNFTNTAVFNRPQNNLSNRNFGVVSSTVTDPRIIQLSLKLSF